ncbi:hypothetical protein EVAR_69420_1 [Eumeta japonica]|uniref:Uncharacterized protein n=1 Tax=Eumeta variegata TaxID=151549 RepID=A0A4C1ZCM3_EUMVA|nr:hypothetical protein EVAR_69420_1 [Eumeta japonica]
MNSRITNTTYWTDSKTVLSWINADPRSFKPFVAHRLAEIEETSSAKNWRWVPSKDNVADDATRDPPNEFSSEHRWFKGEKLLFQKAQRDNFGDELRCIKKGEPMPKKSKLRNMCVELDQDDVMRATGRLDRHQSLDAESKRPVILDSKNRITELLIQNAHQKCMHGNHETVINELRQKYVIFGLRNAVKGIIFSVNGAEYRRNRRRRNRENCPQSG